MAPQATITPPLALISFPSPPTLPNLCALARNRFTAEQIIMKPRETLLKSARSNSQSALRWASATLSRSIFRWATADAAATSEGLA